MSALQRSVVFLTCVFCAYGKDLFYYHSIKNLSSKTFLGQDVKNVNLLDLRNCDVEHISKSALSGMSKLKYLFMKHNNIESLDDDVFNNLENNLQNLRLDNNKLQSIPVKLFAKLSKLQELGISSNVLSKLDPGTFDKNTKLKEIYLEYNRLKIIPARLFSKLTELKHLDISNNFISSIHDTALPNNLKGLIVFSNRLRFINEKHVNNLEKLILDKNPWYCDCRIKQVHKKWKRNFESQGWKPHCTGPKQKNNIEWDTLSSDEFVCNNEIITLYPEGTEIPAMVGKNVTISCFVKGEVNLQNVKFTYGNNTEVTNQLKKYDHPYKVEVSSNAKSLWYNLTILNVRKVDDEIYKCVVKNNFDMEIKVRVEEYFSLSWIRTPSGSLKLCVEVDIENEELSAFR